MEFGPFETPEQLTLFILVILFAFLIIVYMRRKRKKRGERLKCPKCGKPGIIVRTTFLHPETTKRIDETKTWDSSRNVFEYEWKSVCDMDVHDECPACGYKSDYTAQHATIEREVRPL
jgi:predicted RNA-binding Zn-ribbon protein involved in translation (DUF1610 family)